jgi:carbon-monoxide dehydrogenase large subunit
MPHLTRTAISDVLGFPESNLRVIAPDVGGGFGQKMSLASEYVVLVWLARKLKSSLSWIEDRRENLIASFHSRDQYITLEGAFDKNARLLALKADIVANVGAYSCFPTTCGVEPLMAMAEMPGPYDVQQYQCLARGVVTNTCTMAPYRGVSRPGDHVHNRAADGQGRARVRHRPDRHQASKPDRQISLQVGDGPGIRRGHVQRDA